MKIHSRAMLAAVGLAVGATFSVPAFAQSDQQSEPKMETQQTAPASSFDDAKLKSFAVAFLQVDKVRQEYSPKMKGASSQDEQKKVQTEAGQKMIKAVEDAEGISVDEYNTIIQSAQADPELANKLNDVIQKEAAE